MDKLYTILFKVPELQRKILMTAMFLAIYRIGYYIPLHVVDQAQLAALGRAARARPAMGKVFGTLVDARRLADRHEHDLRPGDHALYLRLDHLPAPGERRPLARSDDEGGGERAEEDQRIHPLRDRRPLPGPEYALGPVHDEQPGDRPSRQSGHDQHHRLRPDHDGRDDLPDVDRRADRRVRDRQRDQPPDHGRHPRPDARRHERADPRLDHQAVRRAGQARDRGSGPARDRLPGGGRRGDRDHREPAADPHPVGQARPGPAGLRRDQAVPAAQGEPGRRHADHLRLEPADVPLLHPQWTEAGDADLDQSRRSTTWSSR